MNLQLEEKSLILKILITKGIQNFEKGGQCNEVSIFPYWAYIGFVYKIGLRSVSHIRSVYYRSIYRIHIVDI